MTKRYSPEVLHLRDRVRLGNDKLNKAWEQIKELDHSSQEWSEKMEEWHLANERLSTLSTELQYMGYEDCLYLNEKGEKMRKCLGGLGCRVCPSRISYWERELMELPGPRGRRTGRGADQMEFVEKTGGKG